MNSLSRVLLRFFIWLPLLCVGYLSVVTAWQFPLLWDAPFSLVHWQGLLQQTDGLAYSLGLSLLISGTLALSGTLFGFWISRELCFRLQARGWLQLAYYPYLIAPVVLGAMLQFYFVRWNLTGTTLGVMLAQSLFILPYSVLLLSTFWNEEIRKLAGQASSLGASKRQVDQRILLPLARPWLVLSLVQCFLISWFEYGITQLIGVGKVPTLTIKVMHFVKEANPHQAALAACLMLLPLLFVLLANRRLLTNRMAND
jgi:putative spermidine/putrescine transport system permease protein